MDELSDEMLKIIDLVKAGEKDLVQQLLEGNPDLCSDSSNETTSKIYLTIWPDDMDLDDWYAHNGTQEWTIKDWLLFWGDWIRLNGYD